MQLEDEAKAMVADFLKLTKAMWIVNGEGTSADWDTLTPELRHLHTSVLFSDILGMSLLGKLTYEL